MTAAAATVVVVSGVAGSGKTTVGQLLAVRLGWTFLEGDDLHPAANVAAMAAGRALTDADRAPWLDAIDAWIVSTIATGRSGVVACSALKRSYRDRLRKAGVRVVQLDVPGAVAEQRVVARTGHFMPAALVASQLHDFEPGAADEDVLVVAADERPPPVIVDEVVRRLQLA